MPQTLIRPDDYHNQTLVDHVHPQDWQNPTPNGRYNLVVIGGGSAGLVSAIGAAGVGAKVALVERHLLGGDCLNVGCVPSKALLRTAKAIGDIQKTAELGIHVPGGVTVDFDAVMERMRRIRASISRHDSVQRLTDAGVDVFLGEARFTGPSSLAVGSQTLAFSKAVIAAGSRPATLPIPGLDEAGYLTNETLFELTKRPQRLAVIGGGPTGAEMAQAFRRFGSEVRVFDVAPQMLGREDEDAVAIIERRFQEEGIHLYLDAKIKEVRQQNGEKTIIFDQKTGSNGRERRVTVDEILIAVGRKPNVEGLNLEAAGVETNEKGLVIDDHLQTTNPDIFGAGDVAMAYQFTHAAGEAARLVIRNALFLGRQQLSDLVVPWVTYTDPEVAHVGMSPRDAAEKGIEIDTFKTDLRETDRGRTDGVDEGFVKIHVKQGSDDILGATIVAPHAGEMISEITLAMVAGAGLGTLTNVIHPYPTQAEAIRKTADSWNRTRLTPTIEKIFDLWLSWRR